MAADIRLYGSKRSAVINRHVAIFLSHSGARLSSGLTGWCASPMTMAGPLVAGESGQRGKRARSPDPTSILANQIRQVLMRR